MALVLQATGGGGEDLGTSMQVGKSSAMKHLYNHATPHACPTMHCILLVYASFFFFLVFHTLNCKWHFTVKTNYCFIWLPQLCDYPSLC